MSDTQKTVNPGPLGLIGFGMTTILLCLSYVGVIRDDGLSMILAMAIAIGGGAQFVSGITGLKIGDTFGGTVFTSYGLFYWSLCIILIKFGGASETAMGLYLLIWGIYTLFNFIAVLKADTASKIVFFTLAALFFLLSINAFTGSEIVLKIAGVVGIFSGATGLYAAMAQMVNAVHGKKTLPI